MARALLLIVSFVVFLVFVFVPFVSCSSPTYNVQSFGAKADGVSDTTPAFLKAWSAACGSVKAAAIYVPAGLFLLGPVEFRGPCKNKINFRVDGTVVAPSDYWKLGNSGKWILFVQVNGVTLAGGTFDGKGAGFWACRRSGKSCPVGTRSITFNWANNIVIKGLTSIDSQLGHLVINSCKNVTVRSVKIVAPDQSPNTDGIHVQLSTGVTIVGSSMKTGDDCISIGPGTRNLWMQSIQCGPGHGVSIGSLARQYEEDGVQNITLTNSMFTGSDNGVRIKSWARPSKAFVRDVTFQNIEMKNAKNPIIIDQNYCPGNQGCPNQTSGVKISGVTYKNIQGTSATPIAVAFDCSSSNPCSGIKLQDVKLTYLNKPAQASCSHIEGTSSGLMVPESCL